MNLKKLIDIDPRALYYKGTKLRKYNVGLNVLSPADDYYDYILVYASWENSMILVNITEGPGKAKAGSVYGGHLRLETGSPVVNKESFRQTLGDQLIDWYILEEVKAIVNV